jgi:hypothetical protein
MATSQVWRFNMGLIHQRLTPIGNRPVRGIEFVEKRNNFFQIRPKEAWIETSWWAMYQLKWPVLPRTGALRGGMF